MKYDIAQHNESRKIDLPSFDVAAQYNAGRTVAEIAEHYGVSVQPIKRILKEAGVQMRRAVPRRGRVAGDLNPSWKGGRRVRSDGYVLVWTPDGERLEHRVVIERHIGRALRGCEVVHHKDGNPSNNCLENLELHGSQRDHARQHGVINRATLLTHGIKQCTQCGIVKPIGEFYATKHNRMGIQSWCKQCKNQRDSDRRRKRRKKNQ